MKLEKLVTDVSAALKKRGLKLVTAESCTGGGLSYWLTSLPGSSEVFDRGYVAYSNPSKVESLSVSPITIDHHGAVSEDTVCEMAEGALHKSHADVSIAITGIAGPDGGTPDKPVGTVWIAWAWNDKPTVAKVNIYPGNREEVRNGAMITALEELLWMLEM